MIAFYNAPDSISERIKNIACEVRELGDLDLVACRLADVKRGECYDCGQGSDNSMMAGLLKSINENGEMINDVTDVVALAQTDIQFVNVVLAGNKQEKLAIATISEPNSNSHIIELLRLSSCKRYMENMELRYNGNKEELCIFLLTYIQLLLAYMMYCSSISNGIRSRRDLNMSES